jgi:hypothetical protein
MKWNYGNPPEPKEHVHKKYLVSMLGGELENYTNLLLYAGDGSWYYDFFEYENVYAWTELPDPAPLEDNK